MLFGRKKPGFIQTEEIRGAGEADVIKEGAISADGSISVEGSEGSEEKPELLAYLSSLPEAEDSFAEVAAEIPAEEPPKTEAQKFADYIRLRTRGSMVTAKKSLEADIPNLEELLKELKEDETCKDIETVEGKKDIYYYSKAHMSDNYAMIAALVEDKDLRMTIASMVRFNCKTYPAPTPLSYFERHPYYATMAQIQRAIDSMNGKQEFEDIQKLTNSRGVPYLYSEHHMKKRYAASLIEDGEYVD